MTLGIMLHNFGKSKNLDFPKFHITKNTLRTYIGLEITKPKNISKIVSLLTKSMD